MQGQELYIKGFNHGYLLTKHLPELVARLVNGLTSSSGDYLDGFFSGKEEYELELGEIKRGELEQLRNRTADREHGREE